MEVKSSTFFCVVLLAFLCSLLTMGLLNFFMIGPKHLLQSISAKSKNPSNTTTTIPPPTTKMPSVEDTTVNHDNIDVTGQIDLKPIIQKEQDMKEQTGHLLVNAAKPMKIGKEEKVEMEDEGAVFEEVEEEEVVVKKKKATAAPNNNK